LMLMISKVCALDRLLLERFWGKAGRGLTIESSRCRERPGRAESLFEPVLIVCSQGSETRSRTGHNAGIQTYVCGRARGAKTESREHAHTYGGWREEKADK
jgi:hypothetical protein